MELTNTCLGDKSMPSNIRNIIMLFTVWATKNNYKSTSTFILVVTMATRNRCQMFLLKVGMGAKIRNRYNQVPHMTQDTNRKVTNSQLYTTNKSQEVSPFPAGGHKAQINRRTQRHNKHKTEKNIKNPHKKYRLGMVSKIFYWRALTGFRILTSLLIQMWIKTHR